MAVLKPVGKSKKDVPFYFSEIVELYESVIRKTKSEFNVDDADVAVKLLAVTKKKPTKVELVALTNSFILKKKSKLGKSPKPNTFPYPLIKNVYQFTDDANKVVVAIEGKDTKAQYILFACDNATKCAKLAKVFRNAQLAPENNFKNAIPEQPPTMPTTDREDSKAEIRESTGIIAPPSSVKNNRSQSVAHTKEHTQKKMPPQNSANRKESLNSSDNSVNSKLKTIGGPGRYEHMSDRSSSNSETSKKTATAMKPGPTTPLKISDSHHQRSFSSRRSSSKSIEVAKNAANISKQENGANNIENQHITRKSSSRSSSSRSSSSSTCSSSSSRSSRNHYKEVQNTAVNTKPKRTSLTDSQYQPASVRHRSSSTSSDSSDSHKEQSKPSEEYCKCDSKDCTNSKFPETDIFPSTAQKEHFKYSHLDIVPRQGLFSGGIYILGNDCGHARFASNTNMNEKSDPRNINMSAGSIYKVCSSMGSSISSSSGSSEDEKEVVKASRKKTHSKSSSSSSSNSSSSSRRDQ